MDWTEWRYSVSVSAVHNAVNFPVNSVLKLSRKSLLLSHILPTVSKYIVHVHRPFTYMFCITCCGFWIIVSEKVLAIQKSFEKIVAVVVRNCAVFTYELL